MQLELNWTWIEIQINWIQFIELNSNSIESPMENTLWGKNNVGWFFGFKKVIQATN
jgi:hypothetical protein